METADRLGDAWQIADSVASVAGEVAVCEKGASAGGCSCEHEPMTSTVPPATADGFFEACEAFHSTVGFEDVHERWEQQSCLSEYTIGGIAGHVVSMLRYVADSLDLPPPDGVTALPIEAAYGGERYAAIPESTHELLIALGQAEATKGPEALRSEVLLLVGRLRQQLPAADAARPIGITAMRLDDYLRTRVVEIVVHTDDIAASVGAQPTLRMAASREALDVLGEVASPPSLLNAIRALSRPNRTDPTIKGVF